jgi:hypothetical protein
MILDKKKICIEEISLDEYSLLKRKQKLRPPFNEKTQKNTIYGIINQTIEMTVERLAKEIAENWDAFRRINQLRRVQEENAKYYLKRSKKETVDSLAKDIYDGRGIDLIFSGSSITKNREAHFYRLIGNQAVLVEIKVPYSVLKQGVYTFRRSSPKEYSRLFATYVMPQQDIQREYHKRRNP